MGSSQFSYGEQDANRNLKQLEDTDRRVIKYWSGEDPGLVNVKSEEEKSFSKRLKSTWDPPPND